MCYVVEMGYVVEMDESHDPDGVKQTNEAKGTSD
jgi:hypothetical protein